MPASGPRGSSGSLEAEGQTRAGRLRSNLLAYVSSYIEADEACWIRGGTFIDPERILRG
jgi:hypothetical protein